MSFFSYSSLKGLIFTSNFHSVYIITHEKSHLLCVLVFIWGLVAVQSQILLNFQLVPSIANGYFIIEVAVYKVSIILTSNFLIYQRTESFCTLLLSVVICCSVQFFLSPLQHAAMQKVTVQERC